jgi:class 3 adenylate cyclase
MVPMSGKELVGMNSDVDVMPTSVKKVAPGGLTHQTQMPDEDIDQQMNKIAFVDGKAIGKDVDMEELMQETNVGKKLGSKTNKIVITLILSIMMTIPLFSADTYIQEDNEMEGALTGLSYHMASITLNEAQTPLQPQVQSIFNAGWNKVVEKYSGQRNDLVWMRLYLDQNDVVSDIRPIYGNPGSIDY